MKKINGFTEEDAKNFIEFIKDGKEQKKTLSSLFEDYAKKTGRAKGSLRNYYYKFLKSSSDERVKKILEGSSLHAEEIIPFSPDEEEEMLKNILSARKEGLSVRGAIIKITGGDEKLTLRYQNKYRNIAKNEPERIVRTAQKVGFLESKPSRSAVEREIDKLYERLTQPLKEENSALKSVIEKLRYENAALKQRANCFHVKRKN